jgi:hypothetical protein
MKTEDWLKRRIELKRQLIEITTEEIEALQEILDEAEGQTQTSGIDQK